jgi:hypothetical protein
MEARMDLTPDTTPPASTDINLHDSIDEQYAEKWFSGKSHEEAVAMFEENFASCSESLQWMGPKAFCFYVHAATQAVLEGTLGEASVFSFVGAVESQLERGGEHLETAIPVLKYACERLLAIAGRLSDPVVERLKRLHWLVCADEAEKESRVCRRLKEVLQALASEPAEQVVEEYDRDSLALAFQSQYRMAQSSHCVRFNDDQQAALAAVDKVLTSIHMDRRISIGKALRQWEKVRRLAANALRKCRRLAVSP